MGFYIDEIVHDIHSRRVLGLTPFLNLRRISVVEAVEGRDLMDGE